ncbi:cupin [Brevibacterium sp. 50QC2O2]|jgi:quercetin dioxygenase-like cupin family protein|uniref:cupin n=1 Tax=Brevibacterium TaxID=1696 RepID=UPI00211BADDD|nr:MULTISPECIES: cupin [unclassified Brevibacterium]MCQ9367252.1 cupin [Brevibacterium sp. 91QC2O2]MCQ9385612.1 cupin [Brevibacterium sp. 68QC2CO]MCQ9389878.1 cupin [Brevibacterium sp. 50QC2O2]
MSEIIDAGTGSTGEVQIDNERFRATRWTIEPGGHIPMHLHEFDYVVVPVNAATMHVTQADGTELDAVMEPGVSYTRTAGQEHMCANPGGPGDPDVVFVEVERLS